MTGRLLRGLAAGVLILWLVLPFVPLVIWSFARGWRFPDLLPQQWSGQGWSAALAGRSGVLESLWQTALIAALATALAVLIGVPAGRALGLHRFPGKGLVEALILAPLVVPGIAVALGLHAVLFDLGLTNTLPGVVLAHLVPTLPYMILVMAGMFATYDPEIEEQARSLGARRLAVFRHVTLPAILPGVITGALFAFLVSWGQYVLTLVIGGGRVQTLPLLLFNFAASGRNDIAGALALLYVAPGVVVLILTARQLARRPTMATGLRP